MRPLPSITAAELVVQASGQALCETMGDDNDEPKPRPTFKDEVREPLAPSLTAPFEANALVGDVSRVHRTHRQAAASYNTLSNCYDCWVRQLRQPFRVPSKAIFCAAVTSRNLSPPPSPFPFSLLEFMGSTLPR